MKFQQAFSKVIAKAWTDQQFKEQLLNHPQKVLKEYGIELPKAKKIEVHENTGKVVHLVIPEKPAGTFSAQDLEDVAGGATAGGCNFCG